ncbi:MAG: MerR family transcriptional regulator [Spirochaetales bacterium]
MKRIPLGEVCRILNVKPHVLRYWEQAVPLFDPEKDRGGRRTYGEREIHLLFRMKHLIQHRKYTVEGAFKALLEESQGEKAEKKAKFQELRREILEIQECISSFGREIQKVLPYLQVPGQEHIRELLVSLPKEKKRVLLENLLDLSRDSLTFLEKMTRQIKEEKVLKVNLKASSNHTLMPSKVEEVFAKKEIALVTFLPENRVKIDLLPFIIEKIRTVEYTVGQMVPWFLFGSNQDIDLLLNYFSQNRFFGREPASLFFRKVPSIPYLWKEKLVVDPQGNIATYYPGAAGSLLLLQTEEYRQYWEHKKIRWLYVLPLNSYSLRFPQESIISESLENRNPVVGTVIQREKEWITTGIYCIATDFLKTVLLPFSQIEESKQSIIPTSTNADDVKGQTVETVLVKRCVSGVYRLWETVTKPTAYIQER